MKKVTEIKKTTSVEKADEKNENLWNSITSETINTCDYLAEIDGLSKFNYGIVNNMIIQFSDGVKPSSVLEKDTSHEEIENLPTSNFSEYGILRVLTTEIDIQSLKKPNGWGLYLDDASIVLIITNGSTFKSTTLRTKVRS